MEPAIMAANIYPARLGGKVKHYNFLRRFQFAEMLQAGACKWMGIK